MIAKRANSEALFRRAQRSLPGGNTRHSVLVAPHPYYMVRGDGCRLVDADGVVRIDFQNNYTSMIHGHGHPSTLAAVRAQIEQLVAVAAPTEQEILLAEHLVGRVEGVEQVRFCNSGSEAVMMAVKAARAFTGRPTIAKAEGAYHGAYDAVEVSQSPSPALWGPPERPASVPLSAGTPQAVLDTVLVLPWNDVEATRARIREAAHHLAAIIVDPMPSRMAFAKAEPAYLAMLAEEARAAGTLLLVDEVYNLRLGMGGAQQRFGITGDLVAMGKIIGGGFPVGAVGGRVKVMAVFADGEAPSVYHSGTFNANPVTMAAGLATMEAFDQAAFDRLDGLGERLRAGLADALRIAGVEGRVEGAGSLAMLRLSSLPIRNFRDLPAAMADAGHRQPALFRGLLDRGIFISSYGFFVLSTAMGEAEVDLALEATLDTLRTLPAAAAA